MNEIETLKKLGLTEYESQIILTLLSIGSSKVGEIAKKCSVPKNKIYESLTNLLRKGIVEEIPSTPKKYFIKNINSLNILIRKKEEELKKLKQEFNELGKIKENHIFKSVNEPIGIVYGHEAFVNKIKEAMEKVSKENLIFATKFRIDPIILRLTKQAIKRGAKVKMILPEKNKNLAKEWKNIGVKIRFLKEVNEMTFSIFDDKICRLNLNITDTLNDPTLWIENKAFISILKDKFQKLWKIAKK